MGIGKTILMVFAGIFLISGIIKIENITTRIITLLSACILIGIYTKYLLDKKTEELEEMEHYGDY